MEQYGIESYIAVPLVQRNGEYFGTLCALDPNPANLTQESFAIFQLLANLISFELEADKLDRQREEQLKEAERTGKLREKLIGVLGHDLRSPLNNIKMASQILLMNSQLPPVEESIIKKMARGINRMDRMIGDLLDFTRTRLGEGIPMNPQIMDLSVFCQEAVSEAEINYPMRSINFKIAGNCQAKADGDRTIQVISNLINNALQYSPADSAVEVSLTGETEQVVLEVTNQGKPIPAETLVNIFDPFNQGEQHNGSHSPTASLGLGLYIVQQIMLAHKGTISVISSEIEGTTFRAVWRKT